MAFKWLLEENDCTCSNVVLVATYVYNEEKYKNDKQIMSLIITNISQKKLPRVFQK